MLRLSAALCVCLVSVQVRAENLLVNPSAEAPAEGTRLRGWGTYIGAGSARLTAAAEVKRSGRTSACLELTGWYLPEKAKDSAENRSVNAALVLAENNGYSAEGALPVAPGRYAFSFWYCGDLPTATVSVTGWASADADHTGRIGVPAVVEGLRPTADWRQCVGTFQVAAPVKYVAVTIHVGGRETNGARLGKLYVDDAEVTPRSYPDGQMRAIWCAVPKATNREDGRPEVTATLDRLKACGLNTLFVWTESLYAASLLRPDLAKPDARARWDGLGEMIKAAAERRMHVHIWYSPWIYKDTARAVELREHPDWAAVNSQGSADGSGVCLARPEVRRFELDLMRGLIERYPDLAGIHIEEPGYNWGQYCYCAYCKRLCREWYDLDVAADEARPLLDHLATAASTDFMIRLRQLLLSRRPGAWLSANGCGGTDSDWRIGRDWVTWARRGYIDFYVPQIYTQSVEQFSETAVKTGRLLGGCDLVAGMAVSWSGIYPQRQAPEVLAGQIRAAGKAGAKGIAVYHLDHFKDEHFAAIREAVTTAPAR